LTVDVLDGTQLEVVDEVPRTVGVVAETCTNTHIHIHPFNGPCPGLPG